MKLEWTRNAKNDLRAIHDTIHRNSPRYAEGLVDRITRATSTLREFPEIGAIVPEYDDPTVRELLQNAYRIVYRLNEDRIEILTVIHGARQMPRQLP